MEARSWEDELEVIHWDIIHNDCGQYISGIHTICSSFQRLIQVCDSSHQTILTCWGVIYMFTSVSIVDASNPEVPSSAGE